MIDILSLPRRNKMAPNQALLKLVNFKTGLPINSLPGWELIPLNCKLPMLKCPDNQVIFSKNKIGQTFKSGKQEFDSSVSDKIPEYNPLHDNNLKTFYSNERNLKRLRENGEITQTNDVICNLKDFNEYRQDLHKSQLYYVLQAYKRREAEQHDRMLINNAEGITKRDHMNLAARHQCYEEIIARKQRLTEERHQRFVYLANITNEKLKRLENLSTMQNMLLAHRKMLTNMRVEEHISMCKDLQRKHMIKLKKLFQFKKDRFNKNLRKLRKQRRTKNTEGQIQSWRKRLDERIAQQERIQALLLDLSKERDRFIAEHKARYHLKWETIQEEIKERSRLAMLARYPKKKKKKKKKPKVQPPSFCEEYKASFDGLLDGELCLALNAAIAMEGHMGLSFSQDDPIYKAATYILNYILNAFDRDLSDDACAVRVLTSRVTEFLFDAKKYVESKATQIINFAKANKAVEIPPVVGKPSMPMRTDGRISHVSFSDVACTIGMGSYEINPFTDMRPCSQRRATPVGSLASLVVSQIDEQVIHDKVRLPHLNRAEIVFIEHNFVKFKRELLVGVDKQVFAAIECHFDNHISEVREELLELDKAFLYDQIVKAVLSYAVNPLNFESIVRLAVSVLSSEIIWELQQTLLKPGIDPRGSEHPNNCGSDIRNRYDLCLS